MRQTEIQKKGTNHIDQVKEFAFHIFIVTVKFGDSTLYKNSNVLFLKDDNYPILVVQYDILDKILVGKRHPTYQKTNN